MCFNFSALLEITLPRSQAPRAYLDAKLLPKEGHALPLQTATFKVQQTPADLQQMLTLLALGGSPTGDIPVDSVLGPKSKCCQLAGDRIGEEGAGSAGRPPWPLSLLGPRAPYSSQGGSWGQG